MTPEDEVRAALAVFDRTFAACDGDALGALFAPEAELLPLYSEPIRAVYLETLVHREEGRRRVVHGRLVIVLGRDPGGGWLDRLVMNSHVRPVEDLPADAARVTPG